MGSSERFSRRAAARALVALAASLALSLGPSCVFETAGIEVPLRVLVRDGASGGALSLRRFDLSVTGVELLPCGPDVALAAPWRARFARALGPSVAHAHERGTPLYVTGGAVLDLAPGAETPAVELGAFTPPPGAYCSVRVQFAPSDEHSLGVDRDPGGLLRTTLRADGTDPATGEPFETRSAGSASVALALAAPLRLSDPSQRTVLELTVDAPAARAVLARGIASPEPPLVGLSEALSARVLTP